MIRHDLIDLIPFSIIPYSSSSYVIFSGIPPNDETSQIKGWFTMTY